MGGYERPILLHGNGGGALCRSVLLAIFSKRAEGSLTFTLLLILPCMCVRTSVRAYERTRVPFEFNRFSTEKGYEIRDRCATQLFFVK